MIQIRETQGPVPTPSRATNPWSVALRTLKPGQQFDAPAGQANVLRVTAYRLNKVDPSCTRVVRVNPPYATAYCVARPGDSDLA